MCSKGLSLVSTEPYCSYPYIVSVPKANTVRYASSFLPRTASLWTSACLLFPHPSVISLSLLFSVTWIIYFTFVAPTLSDLFDFVKSDLHTKIKRFICQWLHPCLFCPPWVQFHRAALQKTLLSKFFGRVKFCWDPSRSNVCFMTKLSKCSWKKRSTYCSHQGKKEVACIVFKLLILGSGESSRRFRWLCHPDLLKGRPRPATHFFRIFCFCQIRPMYRLTGLKLRTWRGKAIFPWQRAPLWGIC